MDDTSNMIIGGMMAYLLLALLWVIPSTIFTIWERRLQYSNPLRAIELQSERKIFRMAVIRDFKRLVQKHLRR